MRELGYNVCSSAVIYLWIYLIKLIIGVAILILTLQEHLGLIQSHFRSPAFTGTGLSHVLAKKGATLQFEAPSTLNDNMQSADILRVAYNKGWIKGDFITLSCDVVVQNLGLQQIVEVWMTEQGSLGGGGSKPRTGEDGRDGRRGALGVWFGVAGEGAVKGQEVDLMVVSPQTKLSKQLNILKRNYTNTNSTAIYNLLSTVPHHNLKAITNSTDFPLRHNLLSHHPRASIRNSHRDAHVYVFPHWILKFIAANPKLKSIKDDVIPWLAKCTWQKGLGERMGLDEILIQRPPSASNDDLTGHDDGEEEFDIGGRSTTLITNLRYMSRFQQIRGSDTSPYLAGAFAPRLGNLETGSTTVRSDSTITTGSSTPTIPNSMSDSLQSLRALVPDRMPLTKRIPKFTAYLTAPEYSATVQPAMPYIRRVTTPQLFLSASLHLAKSDVALPGQPATSANTTMDAPTLQPKIDPTCTISPKTTITSADSLLGPNCTVAEKCVIKRCVLGPNVVINKGARLMGCVLLEGCIIEENVKLDGCILGKNVRVGKDSVLKDCEIGHGYIVEEDTEAKGERLVLLEGMDAEANSGWGSNDEDGGLDEDDEESEEESEESEEEEEELPGKQQMKPVQMVVGSSRS